MARVSEISIGARFSMLTVIGERTSDRRTRVPVRCDYGTEKIVYVHALGAGTHSCGCSAIKRKTKHGMSRTREYHVWDAMIQRCTNPNDHGWAHYGGRGITVHPSFRADFLAFYAEVGPRPTPRHSIDRIDNDRGYEPGNLRWATHSEQTRNQRRCYVCKHGHRIEGDNEHVEPNGTRRCKTCLDRYSRERDARRRAARAAARQSQTGATP